MKHGEPPSRAQAGRFRTALAGPDSRLVDAFDALRTDPRTFGDPLSAEGAYGAHVAVPDASWEMLRLGRSIFLVLSDCVYGRPTSETVLPEDFVELHFTLDGNSSVHSDNFSDQVGNLDLVICIVGPDAAYRVDMPPGPRKAVAVFVKRDFFAGLLDSPAAAVADVRREIASVGRGEVYFRRIASSPPQIELLTRLLANPYQGHRRLHYAHAKTLELLCLTVDLWAAHCRAREDRAVLHPRDVQRLQAARQLLLDDLTQVYTIEKLARAVGTNTAKIKSGFRVLFGCTVFEFVLRARMAAALDMLSSGDLPVAAVAEAVGYRHASSFATAFQQYYGVAPREVRRLRGIRRI
ncbi:MAG: AraC family transcriptional regulator [Pigmentiphaga sp.]|uniref:helix-turn-helix transcriptional regulator n=1 Tax=Pigmentiphaga sp. TaxID=1977564 RepID=UPI0029B62FBE|nr:AraC family transcriptional regulator [Pigmentiphaga sp.]MDX3904875.1 AraC family transcriptional regulator [Pigmentiphaga sp.]